MIATGMSENSARPPDDLALFMERHMERWSTLYPGVDLYYEGIPGSITVGWRKGDFHAEQRIVDSVANPLEVIRYAIDSLEENLRRTALDLFLQYA